MRNGSQYSQSIAHQENNQEIEVTDNASTRGENLLAVFWYIDGKFYGPDRERKSGALDDSGRFLILPCLHSEIWDEYRPVGCTLAYDKVPRGKVVFDTCIHKFKVFTSEKLCNDEEFKARVIREYGLPVFSIFVTDEQYA